MNKDKKILILSIIIGVIFGVITHSISWGLFAFVMTAILLTLDKIAYSTYMPCYNCHGYGVTNKKLWKKIIGHITIGYIGDRCNVCDGLGLIEIISEMSKSDIRKLNEKYKNCYGRDYSAFKEYMGKSD